MKSKTKLLSLVSTAYLAAFGLVSCATDEVQEAYSGEEIRFTSQVSRSTLTTLNSLDGFFVYADAPGYSDMFIKGMKATKDQDHDGYYNLESKVTWPIDVNQISFWAYGPTNVRVSPSITMSTQQLTGITIASSRNSNGDFIGGADQRDLVVAYTNAKRSDAGGMQVPLTFHHALSQVEVRIKKGAGYEAGRVVIVKGAWIMNVHSTGSLDMSLVDGASQSQMGWSTSTPSYYGRVIEPSQLGTNGVNIISNTGGNNSGLMLLPQKFVKYPFPEKGISEASEPLASEGMTTTNNSGTYILVLCRIETRHNYAATEAGSAENPAIGDWKNDQGESIGHIHQLFPVCKDNSGKLIYKEDAYGYTCVPIEGTWLPGKKYVYTLEFCGKSSGGGVYPPDDKDPDLPPGEPRPDDKNPGDPVLDNPISFSVTISDWENGDSNAGENGETSVPMT